MATSAEAPALAAAGLALASFASGSGGITGRGKDSQHRNAKPHTKTHGAYQASRSVPEQGAAESTVAHTQGWDSQNKTLSEDHREQLSTQQAQISEKDSLPSMMAVQQVGEGQAAATDSSNEGAADHFKRKTSSVSPCAITPVKALVQRLPSGNQYHTALIPITPKGEVTQTESVRVLELTKSRTSSKHIDPPKR